MRLGHPCLQNRDAHGDVNFNHESHCGETDKPIAGLLADLKARGLLDSILVAWTSEFGRTPTGQNRKGRDHSPRGFTTLLAGTGVKAGAVVGATDEFGYAAVEVRVHLRDLHAAILHLLRFDYEKLTFPHAGRQQRLSGVGGRVVEEALDWTGEDFLPPNADEGSVLSPHPRSCPAGPEPGRRQRCTEAFAMPVSERIIRADEAELSPRDPHGWLVREGLSFGEAERMLDWLEASGVGEREVGLEGAGTFRVRWRAGHEG